MHKDAGSSTPIIQQTKQHTARGLACVLMLVWFGSEVMPVWAAWMLPGWRQGGWQGAGRPGWGGQYSYRGAAGKV